MALVRLSVLVLVAALMVAIYVYRDRVQSLTQYGYIGIFFITLIANATVFLPIPGVAVVFAMGGIFHPFLIAIFAGCGAATGELSGYLVGFSGQGLAERSKLYFRILEWMKTHQRWVGWFILIFAAIPNPFFDAAGIAAGTLRMPVWRFMIFCTAGSILKMLAFAYAGNTGAGWLFGPPGRH